MKKISKNMFELTSKSAGFSGFTILGVPGEKIMSNVSVFGKSYIVMMFSLS